MPELPEVEVVRQSLNKKIKYEKVKKVIVRNTNLRVKIPSYFKDHLKGLRIIKVERFSKYLILYLSNNSFCLIHLGMSGTLHIIDKKKKNMVTNLSFYSSPVQPKKHNHVEIIFKDFRIVYNDPRRFGFFELIKDTHHLQKRFKHLGPEPFERRFDYKYLLFFFKNKKKNIKNFLIDQNFVSGIGNIYASEILFLSKLNPNIKASLITTKDCMNIVNNTRKILNDAINYGGSSIRDFKNISGVKGSFQKIFKVYQRDGLKCKRHKCKGIIKKKNITNRSTFYCNICQK